MTSAIPKSNSNSQYLGLTLYQNLSSSTTVVNRSADIGLFSVTSTLATQGGHSSRICRLGRQRRPRIRKGRLPPHRLLRQRTRKKGAETRTRPPGNPLGQKPGRLGDPNLQGLRFLQLLKMLTAKMRTSWRKREAAGATWAEEEATREDEETEPTLDVEGVGRQEQETKEEKGGRIPLNHQ